ncbi:hypothetical protein CYY_008989 [Polysphondylium violaceum]|uniref:EGF-like domain-containing protein n=1 Tax=Polysphondylium violaceum TaxID=133409 RepID=A0A8J4PPM1_9MYCE|nr:hypothetical protein CYY_008989 [Polysphondylium violaceum]
MTRTPTLFVCFLNVAIFMIVGVLKQGGVDARTPPLYDYNTFNSTTNFYAISRPTVAYNVGTYPGCTFNVDVYYVGGVGFTSLASTAPAVDLSTKQFALNYTDVLMTLTLLTSPTEWVDQSLYLSSSVQGGTTVFGYLTDAETLQAIKFTCKNPPTSLSPITNLEQNLFDSTNSGELNSAQLVGYFRVGPEILYKMPLNTYSRSPELLSVVQHVYGNFYQIEYLTYPTASSILQSPYATALYTNTTEVAFNNPLSSLQLSQVVNSSVSFYNLVNKAIMYEIKLGFSNDVVAPIYPTPIYLLDGTSLKNFRGFARYVPTAPIEFSLQFYANNQMYKLYTQTNAPSPTTTIGSYGQTSDKQTTSLPGYYFVDTSFDGRFFTFLFLNVDAQFEYQYPFGLSRIVGGSTLSFRFQTMITSFQIAAYNSSLDGIGYTFTIPISSPIDSDPPSISWIQVVNIPNGKSVVRIRATDGASGVMVMYLTVTTKFVATIDSRHMVSGSSLDGVYETVLDFPVLYTKFSLDCYDLAQNKAAYSANHLYYMYAVSKPDTLFIDTLAYIQSFTFKFNNLDVTSKSSSNSLIIKLQQGMGLPFLASNSFGITFIYNSLIPEQTFFSVFNAQDNQYEIHFTIPAGLKSGWVKYNFHFNILSNIYSNTMVRAKFGLNSQLRVVSSQFDMVFPIVDFVAPLSVSQSNLLQWNLIISDQSGLKRGRVHIVGEYDQLGHVVDFNPFIVQFGDKYNGTYLISVALDPLVQCKSMNYYIYSIETEDEIGNKGKTIRFTNQTISPFYKFDSLSLDYLAFNCPVSSDTNPPTMTVITTGEISMDTRSSNRDVKVIFHLIDDISGVSARHIPVCYFHAPPAKFHRMPATLLESTSANNYTYACLGQIPYGFGAGYFISLSVYGMSDNAFNYIGTTRLNFVIDARASVAFDPYIESSSVFYSTGGELYLYGYNLNENFALQVVFPGQNEITYSSTSVKTESVIEYVDLAATNTPFTVYLVLQSNSTTRSNSITITPVYVGPPASSSSSSETPPIILECSSDCGAPQGYGKCVNGACICTPPHNGLDCKASTDNTTVITPNPDKPSVNITIPGTANTPEFTSFISVVALREFSSDQGVIQIYEMNNDQWVFDKDQSSKNDSVTTLAYKYKINNSLNTTITSTIQVFAESSNVTFGNRQLYMNPSTIKFTFYLSPYPFSKSTNILQLVVNAALESSEKVACSYKEFIDDPASLSQYLRIQIEDRSLFGRFIKFGLIDGRETVVSNTALDDFYGSKSTSTLEQSFIALNIPYYTKQVVLDPDFSVLIEQKKAGDQANSVCSELSSSKKLTNAQIAGIVVGGVVFLFIVAALVIYILAKRGDSNVAIKLKKKFADH